MKIDIHDVRTKVELSRIQVGFSFLTDSDPDVVYVVTRNGPGSIEAMFFSSVAKSGMTKTFPPELLVVPATITHISVEANG